MMTLKVMTFNLRFASATPPNAWARRRPVVSECLRLAAPDVIGTQEGLYEQLRDIAADRREYEWIGLGREGGSRGEFAAVFYRPERLEPLEFDHFWLSDTPELVGSSTWGNACVRMATVVKFRDRHDGRQFWFWNTHFDHQVQQSREKSAALLVQKAQAIPSSDPLILVGDFNATGGQNPAYDLLCSDGGFQDSWFSAARRVGPQVGTFHNYGPMVADGPRIDWILTRGEVQVEETEIITFEQNGQKPSDHFPLVASVV